ncbi:phycobilisome linker polypeptide [Rubidibacter lacunae KORDI 51-2]|uniref:Phycobilisome linker polypeptide n=1 Tax=Rubidibacter lacunae KORDI 51-2 TaxID=582515 RepID=U5DBR4_9CHRO|nr:phycobilisome rod-core linker polypeptide [Rubidibacter lacunae]ERN41973.1 phycobilisome linker polypeptide [Rubidibacter lacunae KORDI 51-2]
MSIPLLTYSPTSRNHRVEGYEVFGDEQPRAYSLDTASTSTEVSEVIFAAYRQVFNEQQLISSNRQRALESQLRFRQITVHDFVKGLVLSETFRERNYDCNNNYRFVDLCVQRLLGRDVYGQRERFAWSVVLATEGLQGFVDALLNSDEYQSNFGEEVVPYQRRRILPQRDSGEVTFAHTPRYGSDHLATLAAVGNDFATPAPLFRWLVVNDVRWSWQRPPYSNAYQTLARISAWAIAIFMGAVTLSVALAAWGIISL